MLGLMFRSDGSAIDAAVETLVEELSKLATTGSSDGQLVRRRQEQKPYHDRQQKRGPYSRSATANRKRDERTRAAANQLAAYVAVAGREAGFDVVGSDEATL